MAASEAAAPCGAADVEEASLLAWLFRASPSAVPAGDAELPAYLAALSGLGLEALRREPGRLAEERAQLGAQTRALAFAHYKTFIRSAECTAETRRGFGGIEQGLGRLLDRLPPFAEACRGFMRHAEQIAQNRRMNNVTLNRHTEILEVLEIPQLMDTCVRNSYYEEALELVSYVRRLEKKHAGIPVIQGIVAEVRQSTQLMLTQLIQQLRTNIQLPACLRVIGYLRCMDVFTEAELRITFLQARDFWLRSILAAVPDDDPYVHITKTIEACRVHLFDIVTQYRAIFADEEPLVPPLGKDTFNESAIFHGWVLQKVSQFLLVLERDLQRGVGNRLDSLLGQCMYFGLSFSRVGADFRGQLVPVFQRVVLITFKKAMQEATDQFQKEMNSYTLISTPALLGSAVSVPMPSAQPGTLQPPLVLLDFPPLAHLLNNILVAFNDLRLCCPVALATVVAALLENVLSQGVKIILAFHRAEAAAFSGQEQELFVQFCTAFLGDLVPYLNRCLQLLFPLAQVAQTLGVPAAQVHKYGGVACVDEEAIQELLGSVLPKNETALPLAEKGLALQLPLDLGLSGSEQEEADPSPAVSVLPAAEKSPLPEDSRLLSGVSATGYWCFAFSPKGILLWVGGAFTPPKAGGGAGARGRLRLRCPIFSLPPPPPLLPSSAGSVGGGGARRRSVPAVGGALLPSERADGGAEVEWRLAGCSPRRAGAWAAARPRLLGVALGRARRLAAAEAAGPEPAALPARLPGGRPGAARRGGAGGAGAGGQRGGAAADRAAGGGDAAGGLRGAERAAAGRPAAGLRGRVPGAAAAAGAAGGAARPGGRPLPAARLPQPDHEGAGQPGQLLHGGLRQPARLLGRGRPAYGRGGLRTKRGWRGDHVASQGLRSPRRSARDGPHQRDPLRGQDGERDFQLLALGQGQPMSRSLQAREGAESSSPASLCSLAGPELAVNVTSYLCENSAKEQNVVRLHFQHFILPQARSLHTTHHFKTHHYRWAGLWESGPSAPLSTRKA